VDLDRALGLAQRALPAVANDPNISDTLGLNFTSVKKVDRSGGGDIA